MNIQKDIPIPKRGRKAPVQGDPVSKEALIKALCDAWPSGIVSRDKIEEFSGGLLTRASMSNYDSRGKGPPYFMCGKKVAYPKKELAVWLIERDV